MRYADCCTCPNRVLLAQAGWEAREAELRAELEAASLRIVEQETAVAASALQLAAVNEAADAARKDADTHAASAAELRSRCAELSSQVADLTAEVAAKAEASAALEAAVERLEAAAAAERTRADQLEAQVRPIALISSCCTVPAAR